VLGIGKDCITVGKQRDVAGLPTHCCTMAWCKPLDPKRQLPVFEAVPVDNGLVVCTIGVRRSHHEARGAAPCVNAPVRGVQRSVSSCHVTKRTAHGILKWMHFPNWTKDKLQITRTLTHVSLLPPNPISQTVPMVFKSKKKVYRW
jgi:hypothetical protein